MRKRNNNAKNNGKQRGRIGGVTGCGFMPGKSGNPKGRPSTRGLLNALKAAVSEVGKDGETNEQKLVDVLIYEALKGRKRLAAITTIFDRLEGKPRQQLDFNDITESLQGRSEEELLHYAQHGRWPNEENGENN
jgi:hypothetical protein